jgi:hypothetical protein
MLRKLLVSSSSSVSGGPGLLDLDAELYLESYCRGVMLEWVDALWSCFLEVHQPTAAGPNSRLRGLAADSACFQHSQLVARSNQYVNIVLYRINLAIQRWLLSSADVLTAAVGMPCCNGRLWQGSCAVGREGMV